MGERDLLRKYHGYIVDHLLEAREHLCEAVVLYIALGDEQMAAEMRKLINFISDEIGEEE